MDQVNLFGEVAQPPGLQRKKRKSIPKAKFKKALFPLNSGELGKLEKAFWKFHTANPHVYQLLARFAFQWRERCGKESKLGIKALFERARWETAIKTTGDLNFKLNNNYTAFYARLIMDFNPDLYDVFRLRKQRAQATIGPSNNDLPSGE